MKTIIAGSRSITDYSSLLQAVLDCPFEVTSVVSGGANGVDQMGEKLAKEYCLPLEIYNAKWDIYGKSAGYLRNLEMAKNAESLILLWDGKSKGSLHMWNLANEYKLERYRVVIE